jgi:hypothetical protein
MDEVDLSATVPDDATTYIQDAVENTGAVQAQVQSANDEISSALGFASRAADAVSGVLGNFGVRVGPVPGPSAHPALTSSPLPVQVGSTMSGASMQTIMVILVAVVAVVILIYALG